MAAQFEGVSGLVGHLFRHESGKLSATLARAFGLRELDVVEDIVQDSLLAALNEWPFKGVPDDPVAWLHRVARNKALDHVRRTKRISQRESGLTIEEIESIASEELNHHFLPSEIEDSQLRMIFACCHEGIPIESQIALTLKTLCGFSVQEIADGFLTHAPTIEKRLQRARKYFRDNDVTLEPPSGEALSRRIQPVLSTLYLLFNEGYKRSHSSGLVERDLCLEALRLALLVSDQFGGDYPETYALVAIMTYHAARFDTRTDSSGAMILLPEQDRSQWNHELLAKAFEYFVRSGPDKYQTTFHLEAAIQVLYCSAPTFEETDWRGVHALYLRLYELKPTPIVALHMSVSTARLFGAEQALRDIEYLPLKDYYLFHALRGEFLMGLGKWRDAAIALQSAMEKTRNKPEQRLLAEKLAICQNVNLSS